MKIGSLVNFNNTNKNLNKRDQTQASSNVNFGAYKLVGKFKDPNYTWVENSVYELSNGLKAVIMPKPGPGAISVRAVVRTGSLNEPDKFKGMSHFLEHLSFDGSKGLEPGQAIKIFESKGANYNAGTTPSYTSFFLSIAKPKKQDFSELLTTLANTIKYPSFPKKQFIKEKAVVIQEIGESKDDSSGRLFDTLIKDLFGLKINSDDITLGTQKNIKKMKIKDVYNYHKNNYAPNNIEIFVSGPVNPKAIIKELDKNFDTNDFRSSAVKQYHEKVLPLQSNKISFISDLNVKSSTILIGLSGPQNANAKETIATEALVDVLVGAKHSRLNSKLSSLDLGGEGGVDSMTNNPVDPHMILFAIPSQIGQEQKALDIFKQVITDLKAAPVTQEELEVAKISLLDSFSKNVEKSTGITFLMEVFSAKGGIDSYANVIKYINNLTVDDLNMAAEKYINPKKVAITILQPGNAKNTDITFTGKNTLINPREISKQVLPNNIKLVVNDVSDKIRTAIKLFIEVDSPQNCGASSLILTNILANSTAKHSIEELSLIHAKAGLNINVENFSKGLSIESESIKESLPKAIQNIKEILFEPQIDETNFQKAKNELVLIMKSVPTSAKHIAFEEMFGNSHPEGITPIFLRKELEKVTLQDVQKYYGELMNNSSVSAVLTGPIGQVEGLAPNVVEELSQIPKVFSDFKTPNKPVPYLNKSKILVQYQDSISQSDIFQLFYLKPENMKEIAAMQVLDGILGSGGFNARIFKDLREKQKLAYMVSSSFAFKNGYATQQLHIKTSIKDNNILNNNIEKSLAGFKKHINDMMQTLPTEEEVATYKKIFENGCIDLASSARGQNSCVAKGIIEGMSPTYLNSLVKQVNLVTPQDVQAVARKFLTKPSITSVLTSEEAFKKSQGFLEQLGDLKIVAKD